MVYSLYEFGNGILKIEKVRSFYFYLFSCPFPITTTTDNTVKNTIPVYNILTLQCMNVTSYSILIIRYGLMDISYTTYTIIYNTCTQPYCICTIDRQYSTYSTVTLSPYTVPTATTRIKITY